MNREEKRKIIRGKGLLGKSVKPEDRHLLANARLLDLKNYGDWATKQLNNINAKVESEFAILILYLKTKNLLNEEEFRKFRVDILEKANEQLNKQQTPPNPDPVPGSDKVESL